MSHTIGKELFSMRHLLNPLDLSMDELDNILNLANDIKKIQPSMHTNVTANVLLHFSMSQAHEPV